MKKLLLCLCLGLVLSGCSHINKQQIEQDVLGKYNAELTAKKLDVSCTKVELVAESNTRLTGLAFMSDGTKMDVNVTIDPVTGEYVWKVTP